MSLEPSLAESPPSTLKFNIVMRDFTGFSENEGTNVHAQMSVLGSSGESVATTSPIAGFGETPVRFESIHVLSVDRKAEQSAVLKIAMFSQLTSTHLDKLVSWDELRELMENPEEAKQAKHRIPESEFMTEERYDVFCKVQFLELSENGQYLPVEVVHGDANDEGVFQLHQGLQRRISVTLTQHLSESLPWDDLKNLRVGEIHLIDSSGRISDIGTTTPDIPLKQIQDPMIKDNADGTSNVTIIGQWDSSLHKSLLLDRSTNEDCRVRISLRWDILSSRLDKIMTFSINQHLQVTPRSYYRPQSVLKSFWNQTRVTRATDGLFNIVVRPTSAKRAADLWRMDTSKDYVNGEELLGSWSPRGLSLVKDYITARRKRRQMQEIESARAALGMKRLSISKPKSRSRTVSPAQEPTDQEEDLLRRCLAIWSRPAFELSSSIFGTTTPPERENLPPAQASERKTKYIAVVTNIPKNPVSLKSGHLLTPSDDFEPHQTSMQWKRRFVDLRPPYLMIHSVPNGEAINAINLSYARIDHDPDFKRLLGGVPSEAAEESPMRGGGHRRNGSADLNQGLGHVFAAYGEHGTFLFAARSESQKVDWILKIDQSYFGSVQEEDGLEAGGV
ncbi:Kinesin-like protein [Cyphellophora attinorum]|uniref:Kinesin-like protein n=1 Tax=Cyphellophora attinorum TaxID=1664694 RepID=A0A0N0NRU5_9EURO|nr:Kinesin-like protein [Phialophora attinorum]KPI45239.1 Kinesin-like protein [Phialophora attinorum]